MDIRDFLAAPWEQPLDRLVADGGFCGIFRSIGCIGDSLSSGEFEFVSETGETTYHDFFEHSWGQYLARMAGVQVRNFSRGGRIEVITTGRSDFPNQIRNVLAFPGIFRGTSGVRASEINEELNYETA